MTVAHDLSGRLQRPLGAAYTFERELGSGGMATVYLAHDRKHDRKVAVKVLKPELGAVLAGERFLSEIKVTANLQHPNLLPLFDSGEVREAHPERGEGPSLLYYVMPYIEGETLRARLERAHTTRSIWMPYINSSTYFRKSFRRDARFVAMRERMHLPESTSPHPPVTEGRGK